MKTHTYTVHLEPAEEGGYTVTVPALPGCVTEGETYEQALANAREAIEGFLEALREVGEPIPTEPSPNEPLTAAVRVNAPEAA